jgi:four helix bundle protein
MEQQVKGRTKQSAPRNMNLVVALPRTTCAIAIGRHIISSRTSVGANYRAACRGRSKAESISIQGITAEHAHETCFWFELIIEGNPLPKEKVQPLPNELRAIFVCSIKSSQQKQSSKVGVQTS